jgi:DNA-binding LytR/AlgR family response regulator
MVNFDKVKVIRREKDGLRLELDSPGMLELPVSKTFVDDIFKAFGHNLT